MKKSRYEFIFLPSSFFQTARHETNKIDSQAQFGDLFFTTPDPFKSIVTSSRDVSTITYYRDQERLQQKKKEVAKGGASTPTTATDK